MEGVHFVAGPWFTVEQQNRWQRYETIWISNGADNLRGRLEIHLSLCEKSYVPNH